jgi:RNA polymerase sigma factor (TIGR02999 family)
MSAMSDVTRVLNAIGAGDPRASAALLPLVYTELRKLAAQKMAHEKPGQTLQATALVHEAYVRLVDVDQPQQWKDRGHFFAAAAEAMRRILIENAREKSSLKRGGGMCRVPVDEAQLPAAENPDHLLAIDDALAELERLDASAGQLFKLHYFAGCSIEECGELLGISRATAYRHWTFARAWILKQLLPNDSSES